MRPGRPPAASSGLLLLFARTIAFAASLSALAASLAGFLGSELVGGALFMRGAAAFAGDFALALRIHRREAAVGTAFLALIALVAVVLVAVVVRCHVDLLIEKN